MGMRDTTKVKLTSFFESECSQQAKRGQHEGATLWKVVTLRELPALSRRKCRAQFYNIL
jgi:hypothetical protein